MNPALAPIKARIKNWSIPFLIKISKENSSELWREAASEILAEKGIQSNSKPPQPHLAVSIAKTTNKASHGAVIEQKRQPDWAEVIRQALEWVKRDPRPNPDPEFIPYSFMKPDKIMSEDKITCFDCNGDGKVGFAFNPLSFTCDRCSGSGMCPSIMLEWKAIGQELKNNRIERRIHLRDEAIARNIPLITLSLAERGIIDPSTL